jgi:hypothetical protein
MNFIDDLIMIKTYMELYVSKDEELEFGIMFRGTKLGEGQLVCAEAPTLG